jgi:serine/threonine protein kinase
MNRSRVGEAPTRAPSAVSPVSPVSPAPPVPVASRLGLAFASPLGIRLTVPGLVALVGLVLTFAGDRALRGSNIEVTRYRLSEQTELVAASLRQVLTQAEPVLDRLADLTRAHDPSRPFEEFANGLADLMHGRPGVAYVSASFPDGTFQGAYLDDDRTLRFQESRIVSTGVRDRRYDLTSRRSLRQLSEAPSSYDPRTRDFYRLATAKSARVWTPPYPFFKTHYTGVTRAEALYNGVGPGRHLHAVITVDFDVNVLSTHLRERENSGVRAVLYASDGTVLAYPHAAAQIAKLPLRADRPLRYQDLNDPVLSAFFAAIRDPAQRDSPFLNVKAGNDRYLVAVAPASADPALGWYVAYLAAETHFLRSLHTYERYSLAISALSLIAAVLAGFLFARHIVRARREAAEARADAQRAKRAARELGSYRLVGCLGRGGMGEVWKAEHRLLAREAAIKLINPELSAELAAEGRARFRREAETLASLRSRNTIEIFDYGVAEDGTFFYVMELLDGMDFDSLCRAYGQQPAARVIHLLAQACSSLAEAHDAGLVHRDIKPANLFICRAADEVDVVKVLDFGLVRAPTGELGNITLSDSAAHGETLSARQFESVAQTELGITRAGGLMGTPLYMPPEQAMGQPIDGRADLYALGCVAFYLLTGRPVFSADETPMNILIAHVSTPPPDLRALVNGWLPVELERLLASCLAKVPGDRPSSARALGAALREIVVPPEHAWSEEAAQDWWSVNHPRRRTIRPTTDPRQLTIVDTSP